MEEPGISRRPSIYYRPINPNDLDRLEKIHRDIFPIKYESEFFQSVVNGVGIVSWAAVDRNRPGGYSDELIGFVTAKFVLAKESEIDDLICYGSSQGEETLIYILTLGVVETYRNHGIAMSLINGVIRYASGLSSCRGVYLHVIAYNNPAIRLYNKLMFRCVRRLNGFYLIKRQHFDAFLFVYFINGSRSPCSPLEVAMFVVNYMKNGIKSVASKLVRKEEQGLKWLVCKDAGCVLPTQTKPNLGLSSGEPPLQIPNGTLDLSLLWYGEFTPVQKERVQDFIESLNFDSKEGLDPKVSAWWKVVESYQERYEVKEIYRQKSNRTGAPRIKVKIVRSYVDEKMKYGTELTIENGEKLVETATENMSKVVPVVLLSAQVRSHGLGFCNKTCQRYALTVNGIFKGKQRPQPYVMVSDPEVQCPGECAWPFHIANKGPHGMTYQPPSGEIGADALVIQLATGLADVATTPALTESLFKSEPPYITEGNHISSDYIEEPATKCTRVFGSGALPGFTGRIRVDPITGGAFNSHGINHLKFLIPSVWDPKTKSCWTPM
ncbi:unnamed protein product [Brassica napus]|uniref:histone acetyltransferase n=1 Tax=Brassica napus TaxID=3708 RepID=A0A816U1G0_BRANA|nr:unnamed protein product [Brassica napus]